MRVLVTGATGFIGYEVSRQLAGSGHDVRLLVRRPTRAPLVATFGHELVFGDLGAPASIERAVQGVDAVIHLAGRATFEPYEHLADTLVDGTSMLAETAARAGVEHFVFGSSAFVYDSGAIDASTRTAPALDYGRAKVDAEARLDAIADRTGLQVGSLRLPHVYGAQSLLFGFVRRRLIPFPGDGTNRFAQLHVRDAAAALIAATEQRWTGSQPISDLETPTWNDFFDILGEYAPRVRVVRMPRRLATLGAGALGSVLSRIGPTMVARDTIRGWNLDLDIDPSAAWRELGIAPEHRSVATGIPATLDDVVAFRWRHPVNDWT